MTQGACLSLKNVVKHALLLVLVLIALSDLTVREIIEGLTDHSSIIEIWGPCLRYVWIILKILVGAQHLTESRSFATLELVLVIQTRLLVPDALIFHEALSLEITRKWHHRGEQGLVSRLCQKVLHDWPRLILWTEEVILNELEVVRCSEPADIVGAVSWEGRQQKATWRICRSHHMIPLIVYHVLLLMLESLLLGILRSLEGMEVNISINRCASRDGIEGRSLEH